MQPPSDFNRLTDQEWRELQVRADRFAEALAANSKLDWTTHLAGLSGNLRQAVLHEFIKIDLEAAWKSGRKTLLDEYVGKFPELGGTTQLPAHLVYEEYRVRLNQGDKPDATAFVARFPHLSETLRGLFGGESQQTTEWGTMVQAPPPPGKPGLEKTVFTPPANASVSSESSLPAVGEYQLIKILGKGQFGEVWRAQAPGGVEVAVKVISQPADADTAKRELHALELVKNLRHPALMATLAFWTHLNKVYIVIELADDTLRDRMKECKKAGMDGVPAAELVEYFASAASGLDFLHSKHVFHRDIKPDNILLMGGHAKLADFGLARAQERPDMSVSFAGTPIYMAPEVWGGKYNPQSDLYSLAITYGEARMGRRPVDGKDFIELMSNQRESPPDLKGLPPAEQAVLAKALAKQADKRYRTCKEFVQALRQAVASDAAPPARRRSLLPFIVGIVAILLVAGGLALWALRPADKPDLQPSKGSIPSTKQQTAATLSTTPTASVSPSSKPTSTVMPSKSPNPMPSAKLPEGYRPVDGSGFKTVLNVRYPLRIEHDPIGGIKPTFALIEPASGRAFYIMTTKAWNGLLADLLPGSTWKGRPATAAAMGMTVTEATKCAKALGGRLPVPAEWDAAIGFGGMTKDWPVAHKAAMGRTEPRPVNDPDPDTTATGLADMTGNGREWTGEVISVPDGKRSKLADAPKDDDVVVLRGRNFTLARPLTAADLAAEQNEPQTQFAGKGSKYTGFRVVVPLPAD